MPLFFIVLIFLSSSGLTMPKAKMGFEFFLKPDWSLITPAAILTALGQSFFTLSLGQGTMVTYGSYLKQHENLVKSSYPVVIMDTLVSLLAAVAVFTIVFSVDLEPDQGPGLIFHTLPWVFSHIPAGHLLAVMFFLVGCLSSRHFGNFCHGTLPLPISSMNGAWKRKNAVYLCGVGAFLLGIPSALSTSILSNMRWNGMTFLDLCRFYRQQHSYSFGGFLAVILVGWVWGVKNSINSLKLGASTYFDNKALAD